MARGSVQPGLFAIRPLSARLRRRRSRLARRRKNPLAFGPAIRTSRFALLGVLALLAGCFGPAFEPRKIWEERTIAATASPTNLELLDDLHAWAVEGGGKKYSLYLPKGIYSAVGEDDQYVYYKAPSKVGLSVKQLLTAEDGRQMQGGIFVAKDLQLSKYSAGGYINWSDGKMMLVMSFPPSFMREEGVKWRRQPKSRSKGDVGGLAEPRHA